MDTVFTEDQRWRLFVAANEVKAGLTEAASSDLDTFRKLWAPVYEAWSRGSHAMLRSSMRMRSSALSAARAAGVLGISQDIESLSAYVAALDERIKDVQHMLDILKDNE